MITTAMRLLSMFAIKNFHEMYKQSPKKEDSLKRF